LAASAWLATARVTKTRIFPFCRSSFFSRVTHPAGASDLQSGGRGLWALNGLRYGLRCLAWATLAGGGRGVSAGRAGNLRHRLVPAVAACRSLRALHAAGTTLPPPYIHSIPSVALARRWTRILRWVNGGAVTLAAAYLAQRVYATPYQRERRASSLFHVVAPAVVFAKRGLRGPPLYAVYGVPSGDVGSHWRWL